MACVAIWPGRGYSRAANADPGRGWSGSTQAALKTEIGVGKGEREGGSEMVDDAITMINIVSFLKCHIYLI